MYFVCFGVVCGGDVVVLGCFDVVLDLEDCWDLGGEFVGVGDGG